LSCPQHSLQLGNPKSNPMCLTIDRLVREPGDIIIAARLQIKGDFLLQGCSGQSCRSGGDIVPLMRHLDHRAPKPRACEEALGAGVPLRRQEHDSWRTASFERR
jgi:hypothetical protein